MGKKLSCEQVCALLNFYAEGCLSELLAKHVKIHLDGCPECMSNFLQIKKVMEKCIEDEVAEVENQYLTKQYENFKLNLSAYVDNELNDSENIKIKKIAISNPLARHDLEEIYSFKKILKGAYDKTKSELKQDYSKEIICKLQSESNACQDSYSKFLVILVAGFAAVVAGILKLLYL